MRSRGCHGCASIAAARITPVARDAAKRASGVQPDRHGCRGNGAFSHARSAAQLDWSANQGGPPLTRHPLGGTAMTRECRVRRAL